MDTSKWIIATIAVALGVGWATEVRAQVFSVDAVDHVGRIEDDGSVEWRMLVDGSPIAFDSETPRKVTFEHPLDDGWTVVEPAVAMRDDQGRIVAARKLHCCVKTTRHNFRWQTAYELVLEHEGPTVALPALAGDAPERYWLQNGRFELADGSPMQRQIGSLVAGQVPEQDRDRLEDAFGEAPTSARPVVYAHRLPPGFEDGVGLVRAESHNAFRQRAVWYGGGGFLICLLLIGGAMRWLRDDARAEAADAYLREVDEEIGAL